MSVLEQGWMGESERLDALGRALDPTSIRHLLDLGLKRGASCLEVGAGGGSLVAWMSDYVGLGGSVVAVDLDVGRVERLADTRSNVTVRTGDVLVDDFGERTYEFVHARLVVGHLADKGLAIRNMVRAARPGGWVLVEDADFLWTELGAQPVYPERYSRPYFRVWSAVVDYLKARGFDCHWGRRLVALMRDVGLEHVGGEATTLIGSADLAAAMRLTVGRFGPALVDERHVTPEALAEFDALMADPELTFTGSPLFSVWGRRPGVAQAGPNP